MNPNSKDEVRRALDMYPSAMQQVGKNFGSYVDSPAWMANLAAQTPGGQQMMKDFGITQDELPAIINELVPLFVENKIRIRFYKAFHQIRDLPELIKTLKKISDDCEIENFELFCSALFVFYTSKMS